jgi:hypothetical protein
MILMTDVGPQRILRFLDEIMTDNLLIGLEITLIGMFVVFLGMLSLWLLMTLLVRMIKDRDSEGEQNEDIDLRGRAAIAAVTVALAHQAQSGPHLFPLPPASLVSPWQAVTRASRLSRRSPR